MVHRCRRNLRTPAVWACLLLSLAGPVAAQTPAAIYLDDGYTWFAVTSHRAFRDNKPVSDGWSLLSNLRAWGAIPKRSAFRVVVEPPGGKPATYQFQGTLYPDNAGNTACMVVVGLRNTDVVVNAEGLVPVKVYLLNGDTDEAMLLRSYTLDVRKVARMAGSGSNPSPDSPVYYLARGGDIAGSVISRRLPRNPSYVWDNSGRYDFNVVEILFGHSPAIFDNPAHMSHLVATVDGKPLALARDAVEGGSPTERQERVEAMKVPASHTGPLDREPFAWRQYYVVLPLTWGKPDDPGRRKDWTAIDDHPGQWEVTWVQGTNVLRTWRFTVGADGRIAPHPEEAAGLQFAPDAFCPDATLAETLVPGPGAIFDARLSPVEAKRGGFYGHAWVTPGMQAAAAKVPARNTFAGDGGAAATVGTAPPATGGPVAPATGVKLDDAYLWLELQNHQDTKNGQPFATGWSLHGTARVIGATSPRDTFRVRVLAAGKELGSFLAEGDTSTLPGLAVRFPPVNPTLFTATGPVDVELYHRSAAGNAESLVTTRHLTVGKVSRVRGGKANPQLDAEQYYLDHHADVLSTALVKHEGKAPAFDLLGNRGGGGSYYEGNALVVIWHLSPTEEGWHLGSDGYCRISVDGKRLELKEDKVRTAVDAATVVVHTNFDKPSPRGGAGPYFEELRFSRLSSRLPITWGADKVAGYVALEDHPGRWEVQYLHQQRPVRTWRFLVGADGAVTPHPEQATLSLPAGVAFLESEIPAGGSFADARLVPAAAGRGPFGQSWSSPEGKAMAAKVPSKGAPAP